VSQRITAGQYFTFISDSETTLHYLGEETLVFFFYPHRKGQVMPVYVKIIYSALFVLLVLRVIGIIIDLVKHRVERRR